MGPQGIIEIVKDRIFYFNTFAKGPGVGSTDIKTLEVSTSPNEYIRKYEFICRSELDC